MITYGSTTLTSYNSIVRTEVYYYKSTSATSLSGGSWSTTKPTWENGKYIWQKIRTVYEDGTHTESDPVNITGQQGATGTAAYSYKLNSSDSIIGKTKDGEYTIKKITFSATYKQGTGAVSAYGGRFKIESTTNGSTWKTEYTSSGNESSKEFTIPDDIIAIKCSLYQSDGATVLLDIVTVPVVKDGVDAIGLRDSIPYYLASDKDTGITRLTQGWTRYRPQLTAEKKYLWVYYVSRYSEGSTEPELIEIKDDLVHFVNNGDESPVESCVVDINPVQDLHGYDSPYPAGGGEQLIPYPYSQTGTTTINGITFNVIADGDIAISGTASANAQIDLCTNNYNTMLKLPAGDYTISVNNTNVRAVAVIYDGDGHVTAEYGTPVSRTFNIPDDGSNYRCRVLLRVLNSTAISGTAHIAIKLQKGSSATSWSPYSNICPISGWTGTKVTRTGKNLADEAAIFGTLQGWTSSDGVYTGELRFIHSTYGTDKGIPGLKFKPSTQYTVSVHYSGATSANGLMLVFLYTDGTRSLKFCKAETPADFQLVSSAGKTIKKLALSYGNNMVASISNFQLVEGSTATPYEPYQGTTYPITFPSEAGIVYGGYVDVINGELVVDRAMVDLGTLKWNYYTGTTNLPVFYARLDDIVMSVPNYDAICSALICTLWQPLTQRTDKTICRHPSLPMVYVADADRTDHDVSAFVTSVTGVQYCYKLATPITYQLTPQEITMLCKENNIFADTGQTAISYYDNQTSTDPYVDYSATSAFEYANTAINRATAVYGTCSTDAGTAAKAVTCSNFVLFNGARIQVTFTNANTASAPTLNVNNTGAKQILINQATVSESNQLLWAENAQLEFVYDGTYWVLQNAPYSLYGICSVTEEIPAKVIECAEAVICKGTTITVDFMYSNTSDNTVFNVANIAQKPLLVNGDTLKVNSRFNWHAGAVRTFYFDGQAWNMSDDIVSAYIDEYETEQDEDGIMVHPVGQKNTGWSIGSTLELLKNGVSYIKMWFDKVEEGEFSLPFIRIGKESGNHVLVGDDAVTIREDQKELAHYSSLGITFDDETPYKIGNDTTYIAFEDTDNDAKADSLRIVADSISFHSNGTEKDLRSELESLTENVDLNAQAIEQNSEIIENTQRYIQINPEVPSIKLATNDRNYLLIESNKLGFWVDANETAYMSQNQMNIPTASITNLLMQTTNAETGETIGQIGWVMRTNGHLSLKIMN